MDYKLKKIAKIGDSMMLELGIVEPNIVRDWYTKDFVYIETSILVYRRRINDEAQKKSEEVEKINDVKNRSQLSNVVPLI